MHLPELAGWQWALVALAACLSGASKTGIPGIGIVSVALFALVWPTRESVGIVLLILIAADCVAITAYPRHNARWDLIKGLAGWTAAGVVLGTFTMNFVADDAVKRLIGGVLLLLAALQIVQKGRRPVAAAEADAAEEPGRPGWLVPLTGVVAGFATMIANAAGPVMILYLLRLRLSKVVFVGTAAWFFFLVNLFKVPFSASLNLINPHTLSAAAVLLPAAVAGGLLGKFVLKRIPQGFFEWTALVLTLLAGLKLLLTGVYPPFL